MRYSDVKEKHLYYVDFDTVRQCEFDKTHLAVVLKKNKDKKTAIVMPLTSQSGGSNSNTVLLPEICSLPQRLKGNKSYAVYDKIRSVNFSRFGPVYDGADVVEVKIEDETFKTLIKIGVNELEEELQLEDKIEIYQEKLNQLVNEKIINLAYSIKKHSQQMELLSSEIKKLSSVTWNIEFKEKDKQNGIDKIVTSILKD